MTDHTASPRRPLPVSPAPRVAASPCRRVAASPARRVATSPARQRFLVVKLADLGDALTTTPAIRALRATFPSATIDLLVTAAGAAVLDGLDSIDRLIVFEKSQFDRFQPRIRPVVQALTLGMRLRQARYDRVFLLHHLFTSAGRVKYAALLGATGSPWRGGTAEGHPAFLTDVLHDEGYGVRHEADYWLGVVGLAGAANPAPRFEVAIDGRACARAAQLLDALAVDDRRPRIAICPGTGPYSPARRWPADRYAEVARRLAGELGAQLLVIGTRAEQDLAEQVCQGARASTRNLAGLTDVKALAAILTDCDLFIGNDGGAMNLAVAAGVPVVAVFGPSNHVSWGPYLGHGGQAENPSRAIVLRTDLPCSPCQYRGYLPGTRYGCRARDCLGSIGVGAVVEAARRLLASAQSPER